MEKETRLRELKDRYDTKGVDTGVRLQGEHFLNALHRFDEADPEWAEQWLSWIYGYMYNRERLDDRTRVLVIIGELIAAGDVTPNLANHMRTALTTGATQ
jgi:4-carboxymuconolactone decarboxylase